MVEFTFDLGTYPIAPGNPGEEMTVEESGNPNSDHQKLLPPGEDKADIIAEPAVSEDPSPR